MPGYTLEAEAQVDALRRHYGERGRIEATQNFDAALNRAEQRIDDASAAGLPAPRPYPTLAKPGRLWIKQGRYWIAYTAAIPPVIVGVFFDTADLPGRV